MSNISVKQRPHLGVLVLTSLADYVCSLIASTCLFEQTYFAAFLNPERLFWLVKRLYTNLLVSSNIAEVLFYLYTTETLIQRRFVLVTTTGKRYNICEILFIKGNIYIHYIECNLGFNLLLVVIYQIIHYLSFNSGGNTYFEV